MRTLIAGLLCFVGLAGCGDEPNFDKVVVNCLSEHEVERQQCLDATEACASTAASEIELVACFDSGCVASYYEHATVCVGETGPQALEDYFRCYASCRVRREDCFIAAGRERAECRSMCVAMPCQNECQASASSAYMACIGDEHECTDRCDTAAEDASVVGAVDLP